MRWHLIVLALMAIGVIACSGGGGRDYPAAAASPAATDKADGKPGTPVHRKIIRDASLTLSVDNTAEVYQKIRNSVAGWGGFFAASNFSQRDQERYTARLKIRVPSNKLEQVLVDLARMGRVVSQSETGEDVTDEYVDTQSRMRNLQATETRLLELMARTGSVKDLLEAEKELTGTRERIETLQGRLNHLDDLVAYSTVDVTLIEQGPIESERFWNLGQTVMNAWSMFLYILRALVTGVIYTAFLVPFALPLWLISRLSLRRAAARARTLPSQPKTSPPEPESLETTPPE